MNRSIVALTTFTIVGLATTKVYAETVYQCPQGPLPASAMPSKEGLSKGWSLTQYGQAIVALVNKVPENHSSMLACVGPDGNTVQREVKGVCKVSALEPASIDTGSPLATPDRPICAEARQGDYPSTGCRFICEN